MLPTIFIDRIVQDSTDDLSQQLKTCASCQMSFKLDSIRAKVQYPILSPCEIQDKLIPEQHLRQFAVHWDCFCDHPVDFEYQTIDNPKCATTIVPISKPSILMVLTQIQFDCTVTTEQRKVIIQRAKDITKASMTNTMSQLGQLLTEQPKSDVKIVYADEETQVNSGYIIDADMTNTEQSTTITSTIPGPGNGIRGRWMNVGLASTWLSISKSILRGWIELNLVQVLTNPVTKHRLVDVNDVTAFMAANTSITSNSPTTPRYGLYVFGETEQYTTCAMKMLKLAYPTFISCCSSWSSATNINREKQMQKNITTIFTNICFISHDQYNSDCERN